MYCKVTPCCCICQQRISASCCPDFISCKDFDLSFRQINPLTTNRVRLALKVKLFSSHQKRRIFSGKHFGGWNQQKMRSRKSITHMEMKFCYSHVGLYQRATKNQLQ